jgi:hypothetical protein
VVGRLEPVPLVRVLRGEEHEELREEAAVDVRAQGLGVGGGHRGEEREPSGGGNRGSPRSPGGSDL